MKSTVRKTFPVTFIQSVAESLKETSKRIPFWVKSENSNLFFQKNASLGELKAFLQEKCSLQISELILGSNLPEVVFSAFMENLKRVKRRTAKPLIKDYYSFLSFIFLISVVDLSFSKGHFTVSDLLQKFLSFINPLLAEVIVHHKEDWNEVYLAIIKYVAHRFASLVKGGVFEKKEIKVKDPRGLFVRTINHWYFNFSKSGMENFKILLSPSGRDFLSLSLSSTPFFCPDGTRKRIRIDVLNKLNKTPIFLNRNYAKWLLRVLSKPDEEILKLPLHSFREVQDGVIQRAVLQEAVFTRMLLKRVLEINCSDRKSELFMKWTSDFRGRIYSARTPLSPIGPKYVRPLFVPSLKLESTDLAFSRLVGRNKVDFLRKFNVQDRRQEDYWAKVSAFINGGFFAVQIDARCSAYQHLSALLRNRIWGEKVGTYPTKDPFEDIYSYIGNELLRLLKKLSSGKLVLQKKSLLRTNLNDIPATLKWIEDNKINMRRVVKTCVITKFYGVSSQSEYTYIKNKLPVTLKGEETNRHILTIFRAYREVMNSQIKEFEHFMKILTAEFEYGKNKWTLEDGFIVDKNYFESLKFDFNIRHDKERFHFKGEIPTFEVNSAKSRLSCCANLIHSMDALFMRKCVLHISKPFIPIHDCFICSFEDNQEVIFEATNVFVEIYSKDHLSVIFKDKKFQMGKQTPPGRENMFKISI